MTETGYVIEKYMYSKLFYWKGRSLDNSGWSPDNREAIRFARSEDAQVVLSYLLDGNGRAVQHLWEI